MILTTIAQPSELFIAASNASAMAKTIKTLGEMDPKACFHVIARKNNAIRAIPQNKLARFLPDRGGFVRAAGFVHRFLGWICSCGMDLFLVSNGAEPETHSLNQKNNR